MLVHRIVCPLFRFSCSVLLRESTFRMEMQIFYERCCFTVIRKFTQHHSHSLTESKILIQSISFVIHFHFGWQLCHILRLIDIFKISFWFHTRQNVFVNGIFRLIFAEKVEKCGRSLYCEMPTNNGFAIERVSVFAKLMVYYVRYYGNFTQSKCNNGVASTRENCPICIHSSNSINAKYFCRFCTRWENRFVQPELACVNGEREKKKSNLGFDPCLPLFEK